MRDCHYANKQHSTNDNETNSELHPILHHVSLSCEAPMCQLLLHHNDQEVIPKFPGPIALGVSLLK